MRVIVLGSGTSHGVPMIGCTCPVCLSPNPKNRRFRPSIAVQTDFAGETRTILVDTTPELRLQSLTFGLNRVDAVLLTHSHADHIMGLDDLRRFNDLSGAEIPVYGDPETQEDIRRVFRYIFVQTQQGGGKPRIRLEETPAAFDLYGLAVRRLTVMHGRLPVQAYRLNNFAYVTDTNHLPDDARAQLQNLDLLILDAVRFDPHPTHFGLWEAVAAVQELKPKRALFTHLSHHFDHDAVNAQLPPGMELSYDGQTLEL